MKKKEFKTRDDYQIIHGVVVLKAQILKITSKERIKTEHCPFCAAAGLKRRHVHEFPNQTFQMRTKRVQNKPMFGHFNAKCPEGTPMRVAILEGVYEIIRTKGYYIEHDEEFFPKKNK